jgi:hypothetical protein
MRFKQGDALHFYMDASDADILFERLNGDVDVAFIEYGIDNNFVAVSAVDACVDGWYALWHVQSGPLPVYRRRGWLFWAREVEEWVSDPFDGLIGIKTRHDGAPWFGPGHPGVYSLQTHPQARSVADGIGMSSMMWVGNHYAIEGRIAPDCTVEWWTDFKNWLGAYTDKIILPGTDQHIAAFPSAARRIREGAECDRTPTHLLPEPALHS